MNDIAMANEKNHKNAGKLIRSGVKLTKIQILMDRVEIFILI